MRAGPGVKLMAAGAAALLCFLSPAAASARDIPTSGLTIDDVVDWLQGAGYRAEIVQDDNGRHVSSSESGTKFGVYLFDCKEGRCGSVQFAAGFSTHGHFDISLMNKWNREKRWARGYYDSVNDPWVEMDVDLTPGGTYELLDDNFATWKNTLQSFTTMYDLK